MCPPPDRSKHGGLIRRQAVSPTSHNMLPGSYPRTPSPDTDNGEIQSNGERPIQGADEDSFRSRALANILPARMSRPPNRPQSPRLANGEPLIYGTDQSMLNDRNQHLPTDRENTSSAARTTLSSRVTVDTHFLGQLVAVRRCFDDNDDELRSSNFQERVRGVLEKAIAEFEADPLTYKEAYKDHVCVIIQSMSLNFDMAIDGYESLL
jgi:hypothetical protein